MWAWRGAQLLLICTLVNGLQENDSIRSTGGLYPSEFAPRQAAITDECGRPMTAQYRIVHVADGETIFSLTKKLGFATTDIIMMANPCLEHTQCKLLKQKPVQRALQKFWSFGMFKPGVQIKIPIKQPWPGGRWVTREGDTITSIASMFVRCPETIIQENKPVLDALPGHGNGALPAGISIIVPNLPHGRFRTGYELMYGNPGDPQTLAKPPIVAPGDGLPA